MNIYLIRHGRQNSTLCNVDVELSKEGREQADLLCSLFPICTFINFCSSVMISTSLSC